MVRIGNKTSVTQIKNRSSARGENVWLKIIPKDKDLRVRFLEEPDEWTEFPEHYSQATKYVPCGKPYDLECLACDGADEKFQRTSTRYVANALDIETTQVIPLKMPLTLANKLIERFERRGTVCDRDYTLMKIGSGLDTDYDLEAEERTALNAERYLSAKHDIPAILGKIYTDAWGEPAPGKVPPTPTPLPSAGTADQTSGDEEKIPFDAPDEGQFISEEQLRAMDDAQLSKVAGLVKLAIDPSWDHDELVDRILAVAE